MGSIVAECDEHGKIDLGPQHITVVVDRASRIDSVYRFLCRGKSHGKGGLMISKDCSPRIVGLLIDANCELKTYSSIIPTEDLDDQREITEMFPDKISDDEQIDFALLIKPTDVSKTIEDELANSAKPLFRQ